MLSIGKCNSCVTNMWASEPLSHLLRALNLFLGATVFFCHIFPFSFLFLTWTVSFSDIYFEHLALLHEAFMAKLKWEIIEMHERQTTFLRDCKTCEIFSEVKLSKLYNPAIGKGSFLVWCASKQRLWICFLPAFQTSCVIT